MKYTLAALLLAFFLTPTDVHAIEPLKVASRVAHRYMADASFGLKTSTVRPVIFPLIADNGSLNAVQASVELLVQTDSIYSIGISASADAAILINDKLVASVSGNGSGLAREVAYDTYQFNDYVKVALGEGVNTVVVKSRGKVSLGAVDHEGFAVKKVSCRLGGYIDAVGAPIAAKSYTEQRLSVSPTSAFAKHPYTEWHYANGATVLGLINLARATGDSTMMTYAANFCSFTVANEPLFRSQYFGMNSMRTQNYRMFRRAMLDDTTAPALPLLEVVLSGDGSLAMRAIVDDMARYVRDDQSRLADGTFARPEPRWTVWADDLFMSVPFMVRYARLSGDNTYNDLAARQIVSFTSYLYNSQTGLCYHGWNDTRKEPVGRHWGRANGWFAWGVSEALMTMPKDHYEYQKMVDIHRRQIENTVKYQAYDGMWHQILDDTTTYRESSATAIFALSIARAVINGWVDSSYAQYAIKAWAAIEDRVDESGVVSGICQSMPLGYDRAHYANRKPVPNDPRGLGAFFVAAVEVQRMIDITNNLK